MTLEQISLLCGICAALAALITPIVRLNGLLSRLNALLDSLRGRTLRCEERLDEHELHMAEYRADLAGLRESVKSAHKRIDELKKRYGKEPVE